LEFINTIKSSPQEQGYCNIEVQHLAGFRNQELCGAGSEIGYYMKIEFFEPRGEDWMFRFGIDWHQGGVILLNGQVIETVRPNEAYDLWWGGNWDHPSVFRTTTRPLEMKSHVLEIYASESCCDGRQQYQFKRGTGEWTDLSQDNLQKVAHDCDAEPDCVEVPYEDCVSKVLSTTVVGTVQSFDPQAFKSKMADELDLASPDDVQIISVVNAGTGSSTKKFGKADTAVIVMFRLVGCENATLNYAGARVEEVINVAKELGSDGFATDSVLSTDVSTTPKLTAIQFNSVPSIKVQRVSSATRATTPVGKSSSGSVAALIVVSCITFVLFVILLALLVMCRQSATAFAKLNHKDVESGSDNGV